MNQYEAMFLFDPTFGATQENYETEIRRLMERIGAELVFCKKWDERRLAYRVKGCKRGVYVLTYFNADGSRIGELERDVRISENVLRAMVLRAEGVTEEMMEQAIQLRGSQPDSEDSDDGGRPSRRPSRSDSGADSRPRRSSAAVMDRERSDGDRNDRDDGGRDDD